jgi:hypothetical protein
MAINPRATKPNPERTEPNRAPSGPAGPPPARRKVINRAVELAYGVVDGHIRQGQKAAERLRAGTYSSADFDSDLKMCLDRALRLSKEFGVVGVDFFDAIRRMAGSSAFTASARGDVDLEVKSKKRAHVKWDLSSSPAGFSPSVPPLQSADRSKEPLRDVHFKVGEGQRHVLVVNIPDEHPNGVYSGAIVDSKTNEPGGFVSVRVTEEDDR